MRHGSTWPDARAPAAAAIRNPETALPRCWMGKHRTRSGIVRGSRPRRRGSPRSSSRPRCRRLSAAPPSAAPAATRRSPAAPSASSTRATATTRSSTTSSSRRGTRRQGRVHDDVPHRQAGRHVEEQPPAMARRAEPRRPHHDRRVRAQRRRHRPQQRLAGRQLRRHRADAGAGNTNDYVVVPGAAERRRLADHRPVLGRIINASGANSQPLIVQTNPMPYKPVDARHAQATLVVARPRSIDGAVTGEQPIAAADWAWASCSAANPFPGTPDADADLPEGRLRSGKLYQVVFTAKDPYVLGIGFAASATWRRSSSTQTGRRLRHRRTRSPTASSGASRAASRSRATSCAADPPRLQPGRSEAQGLRRRVADHRRPPHRAQLPLGQPDGVPSSTRPAAKARSGGSDWPDVRAACRRGILDRCNATNTCPKIIEHFGAAEIWALKLTRMGRHGRGGRHPAAAQRAPLLHRRAPRTAAARAASPTTPGAGADLPGQQLRHRLLRRQSDAAHRDA